MALLSIWIVCPVVNELHLGQSTLKFPAVKLCGLPHPPTQILVADGLNFLLVSSVEELVDQNNVTMHGLLGNKSTIITGVIRTHCASNCIHIIL